VESYGGGRRRGRGLVAVAAVLAAGSTVVAAPASAAPRPARYSITELGPAGPGDLSVATAVSNAGVVVGYVIDTGGNPTATRWAAGTRTPLPGLVPGGASWANAVNDAGQVAGTAARSNGYGFPVRWAADGGVTDLGGPSNNALGQGNGIDPAGRVVGGQRPADSEGALRPRLYEVSGGVVALTSGDGVAYAVNARGQVVGAPAFLWERGRTTTLPGIAGSGGAEARAVNDRGQVAGDAAAPTGGLDAVVWSGGAVTDLGTIAGIPYNRANGINDRGQVVGTADPLCTPCAAPVAWLWNGGGSLVALDSLLPAGSGWTLRQANGVNDRGQIVGAGLHNGVLRAFLLTPVRR
jgi:uncharacterized membrane protein